MNIPMASLYTSHTPKNNYSSIEKVDNEGFDREDIMTYLYTLLADPRQSITTSQELAIFDNFVNRGLKYILQSLFDIDKTIENRRSITELDKMIKSYRIRITFLDVFLDTPKEVDSSGRMIPRNPDDYRVNNDFYAANLIVSVKISITAYKDKVIYDTKETTLSGVRISSIPIMTRSSKCNTYKATPEMLKNINEDPTDTGGYLIFNGNEYVITATENITFNKPLIIKSTAKNERVYATILSQRGGTFGNSTQLAIHLMKDYSIFLEIQTYTFVKIKIPFFLLFRLFGVCLDEEIVKMIVYDMDDGIAQTDRMLEYVINGFKAKYAVDKKLAQLTLNSSLTIFWDLINNAANPDAYKKDDEAVRHVINDLRAKLDASVLPHIGILPEDRISKLLHISMLIRDTILVDIGMRPEDDRDHMANKRSHGAGPSLAKVTKTLINNKIITPMQSAIINECLTKSFDAISINDVGANVRTLMQGKELENAFIKYITASEKEGTRTREKIRMVAQPLERKNKLNVIVTMRTINASISKVAKSTKRSDKIRYWHPSADGLICPAHTPETGEKVGTTKLLALTAIVSDSDDNDTLLKNFILEDKVVTPLQDINIRDIGRLYLARIIVNGQWIGVCQKGYEFAQRYRLLRREGYLDRFTSIEWNCVDNTVQFYMDLGRLMRPLLIVDNNLDDFNSGKAKKFCQNIRLTHSHIERMRRGELTFEDLVQKGYVEYIYPGEEILLCPSIEQLHEDRENFTQRWTHCNIECALFGPSALMGPLIDRNEGFRNIMVTIHSKQACGQPLCNIQTATRKSQRFHMHRVNVPIVKTLMQGMLPPNSQNGMLLYAILTGFNQEDSSIGNRHSIERGFLKGVYYKTETVEIEKNQSIRIPRMHETLDTKNQSYAKLGEDGIVPVGTIVEQGDIIVGKVVELAQLTDDGKRYVDKSVTYDNDEPGRVSSIITRLDGEDKFVKLNIEYDMPMFLGDKMSMISSHEVLTERGWIPVADVTLKDKVACLIDGEYLKYQHPIRTIAYDYEGLMYEMESQLVAHHVTANHEMWVSKRKTKDGIHGYHNYGFMKARDVHGKRVKYKRDAINSNPDVKYHSIGDRNIMMDSWLKLLGLWIADGYVPKDKNSVNLCFKKQRKIDYAVNFCNEMNLDYRIHKEKTSFVINDRDIAHNLRPLSVGAPNKYLPDYVWNLSERQCRILLDALIEGDGSRVGGQELYCTTSIKLRDDITRLCLHAGYSGNYQLWGKEGDVKEDKYGTIGYDVVRNYDFWRIGINKNKNRPEVNHGHNNTQNAFSERLYEDKVRVYCLEVEGHVFYTRLNGKPSWTGNSSRAGEQLPEHTLKGLC